jgi:integrase
MTIKNIISNDELKKIIAVLKENKNDQFYDVCIFMMLTGLRLNAILSLKFEDIDFHLNTMVISTTKMRANKNLNVTVPFNETIKESFLNIKKNS